MRNCTKQLLEMVKQITEVYKNADGLKAIAVGASISKDQATEYSDLDIIMIYDTLPDENFLKEAYKINKGYNRKIMDRSETAVLEIYYLNNVECQFSHALYNFYEDVVKQIREDISLEQLPQLIADGFLTVIPLHGKEYINDVKERLSKFPEEMTLKMVERYLRFGPFDELRYRFQKEDNIIWSTDVISVYQKRLICTLLGVNKMYIPGDFRKISYVIEKMKIKPDNFYNRILEIYSEPPVKILDKLYDLTREVVQITEEHVPDFDSEKFNKVFNESQNPIMS